MKPIIRFPTIDRRVLLSSLAMLPVLSVALRPTSALAQARDPLPSWNEGATKASILDFVARVTTQGGPFFVPVEQRKCVEIDRDDRRRGIRYALGGVVGARRAGRHRQDRERE